jgi:hypothetical protein
LRFRLRRRFGILTGTIDKLLITPAANGDGIDVEIIDFKTNRFSSPSKDASSQTTRLTAVAVQTARQTVVSDRGQASFDFEVAATVGRQDEGRLAEATVSVEEQVTRVAEDYQLQMQAYALALRELLSSRSPSGSDGFNPGPSKINLLRATLHFLDPNREFSLPASLLAEDACASAIDEAMSAIASRDATLDADRFPPLPAMHCRMCNFVELCPAGREWLKGR